jgi:DNA-binding GntR family transcriptional regulator
MSALATAQLSPLVHESAPLRRKIAASLRKAIQDGALLPGARLVEKDLCEQLSVSRTSLREALRELEAEGVVAATQLGLIVTELTREEAANIYGVRAALEGLIAEQFAQRASEADLLALQRVVDALNRAYKANEFPAIIAEKDRFYEILCLGAKNPIVLEVLTRLNARINRLRSLSRANQVRGKASLTEIKAIMQALCARDAVGAREAAVAHVQEAAKAALRLQDAFTN